ncbi:histidinol-phosphatase [Camelimonas abortus]|uniref:Histidinol-phosphatase n=1 Tax=Camelimonas abortus TaxID=1017184 RepID=A0ABV7LF34_9HYPH
MTAVDFAAFVNELADISGRAIAPFFRSTMLMENKAGPRGFDPVTEADRAAEAAMRARIRRTFPAHGIEGEEYGAEGSAAEYVWVLDPIDGTAAFISGLPLWGTLIGLKRNGRPVFGMMSQPFTGERFWGDCGQSRYRRNGETRVIRTRRCASLATATLASTSPHLFSEAEFAAFSRVQRACRLTRYGADCYAYCMLAAGHIDLVVEAGLKPCDIAPLIPVIQGAGGVVTTWSGGPATDGGRVVAAGDPAVHAAAMELLAAVDG